MRRGFGGLGGGPADHYVFFDLSAFWFVFVRCCSVAVPIFLGCEWFIVGFTLCPFMRAAWVLVRVAEVFA